MKWTFKTHLQVLSLLILCGGYVDHQVLTKESSPPNIILIMADDLGKEWIECYGAEDINTPNINALADQGILFHNVYAMPQCTPTRVTLLTGQYPFRHGWVNHWDVPRWGGGAHFDERMNPSLGIQMKKAGYQTCIAGKWQIDDFRVEPDALVRNGFDSFCMWTGYETGVEASAERYHNPYIFEGDSSGTRQGAFGPDVFQEFIVNFIARHHKDPMFIYYPMVLTHSPLINPPNHQGTTSMAKHKAMVQYMDEITGKIMATLSRFQIDDNTIVIWTTDNGSARGVAGKMDGRKIQGGKGKTSEAGICVPFIIRWPDHIAGGQHSYALIDFTDLFPTLIDLGGGEPPKYMDINGTKQPIDGLSFADMLRNPENANERRWIMSMGGGNHAKLTNHGVENQYVYRDRVLRDRRFKLWIGPDGKPSHFFDLENDPFEQKNLWPITGECQTCSQSFNELWKVAQGFPKKDNDPQYKPNPPQPWDVEIDTVSQTWKK